MFERVVRGSTVDHRRIRTILQTLSAEHVAALSLAFGVTLRSRDIDDTSKRRAPKAEERNWRVLLAELYGVEGAVVLVSPRAHRLFEAHLRELGREVSEALPSIEARVAGRGDTERLFMALPIEARRAVEDFEQGRAGGLVAWLVDAGRGHAAVVAADAKERLRLALDAFCDAAGYRTSDEPVKRTRSSERTRARILASRPEHGQEIGG